MADFHRYWVRDGDTTTAGGEVMASGTHMPMDGKYIALEGDPVKCPACNSTGVIKCVPPIRRSTGQAGTQMSVDGDLCMCKCPVPPRLIASQHSYSMAFSAEDVVSVPGGIDWLTQVDRGRLVTDQWPQIVEQYFELLDDGGLPVEGYHHDIYQQGRLITKAQPLSNGRSEVILGHSVAQMVAGLSKDGASRT